MRFLRHEWCPSGWNSRAHGSRPPERNHSGVKLIEGHCFVPTLVMAHTGQKGLPAACKAKAALEAVNQTQSLAELSQVFQVHPVQISQWKKPLLDGAESVSIDGRRRERDESLALQAERYEQIGRLNTEVEWLKKRSARYG